MSRIERIETVAAAIAKQRGETGYRLVVRADDETEDEARTRAGLSDWPGPVIFLSESDANL